MEGILQEMFLGLGVTRTGIPFGGPRGSMTDIFFLIASTDEANHLRALARLSRLISSPELPGQIREADSATQVIELIEQVDNQFE